MPDFLTTPPIPYVPIADKATEVRAAINVYSKLETYSQAGVEDLFFASGIIPDPDASAYVTTIETALGTTIEAALPSAINPKRLIYNFIKAEKAAGRWSLHKRIYLPIYNNSAASAVDMVSRTSGTFLGLSGSVTHAAGYVQGDGTSGYFNMLTSPPDVGITASQGSLFALVKSADTISGTQDTLIGAVDSATSLGQVEILEVASNFPSAAIGRDAVIPIASGTTMTPVNGIIMVNRRSGPSLRLHQIKTAGTIRSAEITTQASTITTANMFLMAQSRANSPFFYSNAQFGDYLIGLCL